MGLLLEFQISIACSRGLGAIARIWVLDGVSAIWMIGVQTQFSEEAIEFYLELSWSAIYDLHLNSQVKINLHSNEIPTIPSLNNSSTFF